MLRIIRTIDNIRCRVVNRLTFRYKRVACLTDLRNINGVMRIAGSGHIIIGRGTRVNSGPRRNPIGGDTCVTLVCRGGTIEIGEDCGLSNCTLVADSHITLHANVMIGGGVKIYDTDFHNLGPTLRLLESTGRYHGNSKPVLIGRNAFIGAHAIILKGTTIGENAVIGAGSVVSGTIPPNEIWAGNPACFVRKFNAA